MHKWNKLYIKEFYQRNGDKEKGKEFPRIRGRRHLAYSNTPPQGAASPSWDAKCLTFADGRALVSVSATISSVGQ